MKPGHVVRHLCHNKRCLHPGHLAEGTYADNRADETTKTTPRVWWCRTCNTRHPKPACY